MQFYFRVRGMFDLNNINNNQLDFFRELENIGASHAATALSLMLSHDVAIRVPRAQFCEYGQICEILKGPENVVAGLLVGICGDLNGFILLVMDEEDARRIADTMLEGMADGMPELEKQEMRISAIKELANILVSSYVNAISELTGLKIDVSVPDVVFDMAGAVMNLLAVAYGDICDSVMFMETEFQDNEQSIYGHFFLIPDLESYKALISKMEAF